MSECRNIEPDLSAFVDGELRDERRAEVETHVVGCAVCRARVTALRELAAGLAAIPKANPGDDFLAGVRQRMLEGKGPPAENPDPPSIFQSLWFQWPARVAAVVGILFGLGLLLTPAYKVWLKTMSPPQVAKAPPKQETAPPAEPTFDRASRQLGAGNYKSKDAEMRERQTSAPASPPVALAKRAEQPAVPQAGQKLDGRATPPPAVLNKIEENAAIVAPPAPAPSDAARVDQLPPAESAAVSRTAPGRSSGLFAGSERSAVAQQSIPAKTETENNIMVIESADSMRARSDASRLAVAVGGHLIVGSDDQADRFRVELPASKVAMFSERLAQNAKRDKQSRADEAKEFDALIRETAAVSSNEATTVLEIRVVPPAK